MGSSTHQHQGTEDPPKALSRTQVSRLEQRTLWISIYGVLVIAAGSIAWGLVIESNVVILDGIFSLFSLIGGGLSLLAARLVAMPENRRFPYGYSHLEPLVHSVNGLMMLIMCVYAFINGIEGVRAGGNVVDPAGVIWFSVVAVFLSLALGIYEMRMGNRLGSLLLTNDGKSWFMDALFSLVTFLGFAALPFLPEPYREIWARYADPTLVSVLALLLLPVPLGILNSSLREVLIMADSDDALIARVEAVLAEVKAEQDVPRAVHHIARSGRTVFIEIDLVVGPNFAFQTVAEQDKLRERIWKAIDLPLEQTWLSIALTTDPRWV
jgi:cation diffusion facilitator family transporter